MFKYTRESAVRRMVACGLSREVACQFHDIVMVWVSNSGEEWTVQRLKDIKVDLIRHSVGLPPLMKWVARRRNGIPKGVLGYLFNLVNTSPFVALNVVMIYSAFEFPSQNGEKLSPKQTQKFESALYRADPPPEASVRVRQLIKLSYIGSGRKFSVPSGTPLLDVVYKPHKRGPRSSAPQTDEVGKVLLDSVRQLARFPGFYRKHRQILDGSLRELSGYLTAFENDPNIKSGYVLGTADLEPSNAYLFGKLLQSGPGDLRDTPEMVVSGHVAFLQEPGLKLRHVALVSPLFQAALRPLGQYLWKELSSVPCDACYDQQQGVADIQSFLKDGLTCYSFDLSSASDQLPLLYQKWVLEKLNIPESWVSLFLDVSRGLFTFTPSKVSKTLPGKKPGRLYLDRYVNWRVGQPLGLYPSFPAFSLLHHALVQGLFVEIGAVPDYRILGDDIVIANDNVAKAYQDLMNLIGVPISETKSIVSGDVAEFAGKVIYSDRILTGYKWRGKANDFNFVDLARNLGYRKSSAFLFRRRQRDVLDAIAPIPEPWGLGINPAGLSLSDRWGVWSALLNTKDTRPRGFSPRSRRLWTMLFGSPELAKYHYIDQDAASDQDAMQLVSATLGPHLQMMGPYVLSNLDWLLRQSDDNLLVVDELTFADISYTLGAYSFLERLKGVPTLIDLERKIKGSS